MKSIISLLLSVITLASVTFAETVRPATELPNISLIGNMVGSYAESEKSFDVSEIELAFQHYLYPSVKSDVYIALHKEDGETHVDLEEAYVTFSDLGNVIAPNVSLPFTVQSVVGKKLVGFGKVNVLHPEQRDFVDRPLATQQFLGGAEGLSAEGANISTLLPVPFFSQIELGYWAPAAHHEDEEEEEEEEGVEYEDGLLSLRVWNSFQLKNQQELEVGFSAIQDHTASTDSDEKQTLAGLDVTYHHALSNGRHLKLFSEYYSAEYTDEDTVSQQGAYVGALYKINPRYKAGVRYDFLSGLDDEDDTTQLSLVAIRQLTETSKFKVQYSTSEEVDDTVYFQFIFGMGPHAHVLQ